LFVPGLRLPDFWSAEVAIAHAFDVGTPRALMRDTASSKILGMSWYPPVVMVLLLTVFVLLLFYVMQVGTWN